MEESMLQQQDEFNAHRIWAILSVPHFMHIVPNETNCRVNRLFATFDTDNEVLNPLFLSWYQSRYMF